MIHENLYNKLRWFHQLSKIPNILFYGPNGSGKQTLVFFLIQLLFNHNKQQIHDYVLYVNCAHGKGIKFIRDEIKFFSKINVIPNNIFKCVVMLNADKLTADAQSALRRCIEIYSNKTRFFMITDNLNNIMVPIISRFYKMYVPYPKIDNIATQLYQHAIHSDTTSTTLVRGSTKYNYIHKSFKIQPLDYIEHVTKLYHYGCSANDLIDYLLYSNPCRDTFRYVVHINSIKREIRSELLLLLHILTYYWLP